MGEPSEDARNRRFQPTESPQPEAAPIFNPTGTRLRPAVYDGKNIDNDLTFSVCLSDVVLKAYEISQLGNIEAWNALTDEAREEFLSLAEREMNVIIPEEARNASVEPIAPVEVPEDQPEISDAVEPTGEDDDGIPGHLEDLLPEEEPKSAPEDDFSDNPEVDSSDKIG